jgi:Uma2 family endonuclease
MDLDECLHTSFDGSDRDFLDGEVVERNWNDIPHATAQGNLMCLLHDLRKQLGLRVLLEIRIQISPTRYRVADLAVWRNDDIGGTIPTVPPFLVVEILSPENRPAQNMIFSETSRLRTW